MCVVPAEAGSTPCYFVVSTLMLDNGISKHQFWDNIQYKCTDIKA